MFKFSSSFFAPVLSHEHSKIISLGKKLGYFEDSDGVCCGTTVSWIAANITEDEEKFDARIALISREKNLTNKINNIKEKVKQQVALSEEETNLQEISPCLEHIFVHQKPWDYAHLEVISQNTTQMDISRISRLMSSKKLNDLHGLKSVFSYAGLYTKQEINDWLNSIVEIVNRVGYPFRVGFY